MIRLRSFCVCLHDSSSIVRRPARRLHRRHPRRHSRRHGGAGGRDQRVRRPRAGAPHRFLHEPRLLPSLRHEVHSAECKRARAVGRRRSRRGRGDRGCDGAVRLREDPRPRHPGGAGSDSHRPEPHVREGRYPQAAVFRDLDRHGWTVRRRGADHHDGRRVRLVVRPGVPSVARRAEDAAGGGRGRRDGGGVRHTGGRGPARGGAAAL